MRRYPVFVILYLKGATKLEISPRKGTKPRDSVAKTVLRGTKPPKLAGARLCAVSTPMRPFNVGKERGKRASKKLK